MQTSNDPDQQETILKQQIAELEERLADLHARLPAHSIPPAMVAELDDLDEQLADLRERLAKIQRDKSA